MQLNHPADISGCLVASKLLSLPPRIFLEKRGHEIYVPDRCAIVSDSLEVVFIESHALEFWTIKQQREQRGGHPSVPGQPCSLAVFARQPIRLVHHGQKRMSVEHALQHRCTRASRTNHEQVRVRTGCRVPQIRTRQRQTHGSGPPPVTSRSAPEPDAKSSTRSATRCQSNSAPRHAAASPMRRRNASSLVRRLS